MLLLWSPESMSTKFAVAFAVASLLSANIMIFVFMPRAASAFVYRAGSVLCVWEGKPCVKLRNEYERTRCKILESLISLVCRAVTLRDFGFTWQRISCRASMEWTRLKVRETGVVHLRVMLAKRCNSRGCAAEPPTFSSAGDVNRRGVCRHWFPSTLTIHRPIDLLECAS